MAFENDRDYLRDEMAEIDELLSFAEIEGLSYAAITAAIVEARINADELAKRLCLNAITDGLMTQREAADVLGRHAVTIGRWLRQAEAG